MIDALVIRDCLFRCVYGKLYTEPTLISVQELVAIDSGHRFIVLYYDYDWNVVGVPTISAGVGWYERLVSDRTCSQMAVFERVL